ncbi:MAG: hybrid sensor histidine kinase/response regulator [Rhizobiaceae bacterium]
MNGWIIVVIAIVYVTLLFAIASFGDRNAARRSMTYSRPTIYALSLAIYCTSWTFFGSVGLASEKGFEYLGIYAGPVLAFMFGFPLIQRIVRLAKSEKITSIADFLAARYGKSFTVASVATLIAIIAVIPYIALQLKAISGSLRLMAEHTGTIYPSSQSFIGDISLLVAILLAAFAVLFGTRHTDATEHQDGLVLAIAVESVVKLAAFLFIGISITFFMFGDFSAFSSAVAANADVRQAMAHQSSLATWLIHIAISGIAIFMLPRQFYVMFVENRTENELHTAHWLFPVYLIAINIFVLPIAFAGLAFLPQGTSADLFVVAVPLAQGDNLLAMIAFIGGLSAATAMVIVETVALSIMISNDLVIPLFIRRLLHPERGDNENWSRIILTIRRASIFLVLLAAFLYYREIAGNARLASIGLLSFAAVAQFAPAFFGGLAWRGANGRGALMGLSAGTIVWAYTLLFPSLGGDDSAIIRDGLFGIASLRPQALFGIDAEPLNHGVFWSLTVNTIFFVFGSLSRAATPVERIQAALFAPRGAAPLPSFKRLRTTVTIDDLKDAISRYLGEERTERSFAQFEAEQGIRLRGSDIASAAIARHSEQLMASAVGSSSARLILSLLFQRNERNSRDTIRLLDDASTALQQNRGLLQNALDQMEQGLTVMDDDFRLTFWNQQFLTLFGLPESLCHVGQPFSGILGGMAARGDISGDLETSALKNLLIWGAPWQMELRKSGKIIEIRSNPMPDGGTVTTYTDITSRVLADIELKQANESLEQRVQSRTAELTRVNAELANAQMLAEEANLGKTRFLAAAGHDILQPLNAARLYCSSTMEMADPSLLRQSVRNIESSLESVETILGEVLDISSLDTGALKPVIAPCRVGRLFEKIETDFRPLAEAKNVRLIVVPSSLWIATDQNLFRRLVQNLVSNAIKYTRTGTILVGVRRRGSLAEIQVHDTGIGMPGDKLGSVFNEFTRLDEGAREAPGLGLGLSIVDRIARVLRLEIRLWSEQGKGSCFSVLFEPVEAAQAAPEDIVPVGPLPTKFDRLTVLCVDNDPRILEGMRQLLESWNCSVYTIGGTADLAQPKASAIPAPKIILADYHLDSETGIDAIKALRRRFGQDIPALLLTADRSAEMRQQAEQLEIPVLNKPIKPAALRSTLARMALAD